MCIRDRKTGIDLLRNPFVQIVDATAAKKMRHRYKTCGASTFTCSDYQRFAKAYGLRIANISPSMPIPDSVRAIEPGSGVDVVAAVSVSPKKSWPGPNPSPHP